MKTLMNYDQAVFFSKRNLLIFYVELKYKLTLQLKKISLKIEL